MRSADIRMIAEVMAQCHAQGEVTVDYVIEKLAAAIEHNDGTEEAVHRRLLFEDQAKAPPKYWPKRY